MSCDFSGESVPLKWVSHLCESEKISACGGLFDVFVCFSTLTWNFFAPAAGCQSVPLKWVKISFPKTLSVPVKWVSHLRVEPENLCSIGFDLKQRRSKKMHICVLPSSAAQVTRITLKIAAIERLAISASKLYSIFFFSFEKYFFWWQKYFWIFWKKSKHFRKKSKF